MDPIFQILIAAHAIEILLILGLYFDIYHIKNGKH